nr:hypothetical protein CFP56_50701 [Quercus suber]POF19040.1 hypothetical protein CFP56_50703 [Quercus suber]
MHERIKIRTSRELSSVWKGQRQRNKRESSLFGKSVGYERNLTSSCQTARNLYQDSDQEKRKPSPSSSQKSFVSSYAKSTFLISDFSKHRSRRKDWNLVPVIRLLSLTQLEHVLVTLISPSNSRSITWTCLFLPTVYTRFGGSLELKI